MTLHELISDPASQNITFRLVAALAIGAAIGLERSYHGRPAGFRTHGLVCLSTSLLMLVTVYQHRWMPEMLHTNVTLDPTRMAQGIMTGIGFLGAGTIMKDGLSVRGLTTAASIWITAAIGTLVGVGFYFPAVLATALTLGTLSLFRWIESRMPSEFYANFVVRFQRDAKMDEDEMRSMLKRYGFTIANLNYRLDGGAGFFEYRMVIRTDRAGRAGALADMLCTLEIVKEFRLLPMGD
ncbi:MgtC/SapB family protein [Aquabacterium sp. A7-Y]|uniref:MgtC/SapB family protein n=1 Tax=Aquabacterium sp. A7-Y TaxID=1349605 RepID=UPI00223D2CE4|nr:MgtC/SapB family protein [Aquabacterium sp. A7-Y]MCW7538661.1 MgtC/SapB family protein [Aquabacterium sp. A7-Y]